MEGKKSRGTALTLAAAALAAGLGVGGAAAQENPGYGSVSAEITFASEYVFRGISQSEEDPALQASVNWTHDSGLYVGAWGSTGDFGRDGSFELDWYGGYATEVSGVALDFSVIYYTFPGDEVDGNYVELMAKAGYDLGLIAATGGIAYVPSGQEAYGGKDAYYLFSDVEIPIPNTAVTAGLHLGYEDFGGSGGRRDKFDWSVGLYTAIAGINFGLAYLDTNRHYGGAGDARVLFTVSKYF